MKRERLEDLGVLKERLQQLCDHEVFDHTESKHAFDIWKDMFSRDEELHHARLRHLHDKLYECLEVATGEIGEEY